MGRMKNPLSKDFCIILDSRRFPDLVSFARDFWSGGMDLFLREASEKTAAAAPSVGESRLGVEVIRGG